MSLFESSVLSDVLEIISADDDGSLHFGGDDHTLKNTTTDGNVSGERALLIDIMTLRGSLGGLETQTNALEITSSLHKAI